MANYELLKDIEKYGRENKIPILLDDSLEYITGLLEKIKPHRILEIGTAIGFSAINFSKYLDEGGRIDTIEIESLRVQQALENIEKVGVQDKIRVLEGDALDILPYLTEKYDVIFIDASKGKYLEFFEHALRLSPVGGWIIADNVLYKGMVLSDYNKHKQRTAVNKLRSFIDVVMETKCLNSELVDIGDGLTISKKIKEWEK
ncbi:MAG: O-methyltransferase [Clostridia bacterium]|nr:O-methyltransferase [Clostridia bacterium]